MYYEKSAWFYDAIYTWKDYVKEIHYLLDVISQHKKTDDNTLLDVACGTGGHITHLLPRFACEGLDMDTGMLAVAREKFPTLTFHQADMTDFHLNKHYGVITCMFSSIGYVQTVDALNATIKNFADHLVRGGVVVVEPWFSLVLMKDKYLSIDVVNEPDLKISRMNVTAIEGNVAVLSFHYLVGKDGAITHFTEQHRLAMFTDEEYLVAFREAGLDVIHDPQGVNGRGLFIGTKIIS